MTTAPVVRVEAIPLAAPATDPSDLDAARETVVIVVEDADGRIGIGEADGPARAICELVEMRGRFDGSRGLAELIVGRDPFELRANQSALFEATSYHGRRGLGIHALSGLDVALHDLAARQLDRPVYQLLGGARRTAITPYATIWPGGVKGRSIGELMRESGLRIARAIELGFRAVKMEVIFDDLVTDRELVGCIRDGRALAGDDVMFAVDFGYRWSDWRDALFVLERIAEVDVYFAEACLGHDDVAGHRRLAARSPVRVCAGEFSATVHECREWLEAGVDVVQPDVSRSGGLTELVRIAELAEHHGAIVIPHAWKTGITATAVRHFQAAVPNCPYVEMFAPELWSSPLRAGLVTPEPEIVAGRIALPTAPGLGIDLVDLTVDRYRLAREGGASG